MNETTTTPDPNLPRRRPMVKQYAIILPSLYTGSMRKAGPYILADWPWILAHMDRNGLVDVSAQVLADEIGGELKEHQKAIEWLHRQGELTLIGSHSYFVANCERYRFLWQSIRRAEYQKLWDREHRPSGWQREKARRSSLDQSD
jgi:hypothetical protein